MDGGGFLLSPPSPPRKSPSSPSITLLAVDAKEMVGATEKESARLKLPEASNGFEGGGFRFAICSANFDRLVKLASRSTQFLTNTLMIFQHYSFSLEGLTSRSVGRDTCNCSGAELTHRNTTTTAKCQTQIELDMQHLQECTIMTQESGEESNND